jgi:hypothetical protein
MKAIRRKPIAGSVRDPRSSSWRSSCAPERSGASQPSQPEPSLRDVDIDADRAATAAGRRSTRQADPSAAFTWLRGHVDAFAARPKPRCRTMRAVLQNAA